MSTTTTNNAGPASGATQASAPAPVEAYEANLSKGSVYLSDATKVMELRERAFGTLSGNRVILNPYEAFYLTEKNKIKVRLGKADKVLKLRDLVTRLSVGEPAIWIRYLVYRDLRDRGYLVREKERFDFETFGKGATRRLIYIVYEGGETSLEALSKLSAKANSEGKDLVLAVIDRRTDIVYYTLNTVEDFKEQVNQQ